VGTGNRSTHRQTRRIGQAINVMTGLSPQPAYGSRGHVLVVSVNSGDLPQGREVTPGSMLDSTGSG
jgi:hypothetical protein